MYEGKTVIFSSTDLTWQCEWQSAFSFSFFIVISFLFFSFFSLGSALLHENKYNWGVLINPSIGKTEKFIMDENKTWEQKRPRKNNPLTSFKELIKFHLTLSSPSQGHKMSPGYPLKWTYKIIYLSVSFCKSKKHYKTVIVKEGLQVVNDSPGLKGLEADRTSMLIHKKFWRYKENMSTHILFVHIFLTVILTTKHQWS